MPLSNKVCTTCGGPGPFYANKKAKDGLMSCCKQCHRATCNRWEEANQGPLQAYRKTYNDAHKAQRLATSVAWQKANPDKVRAASRRHKLKRNWAMTEDELAIKLAVQGGICPGCLHPLKRRHEVPSGDKYLTIDHDHTTGVIRDILCNQCNQAFGLVGESIETLQRLIEYKRKHG